MVKILEAIPGAALEDWIDLGVMQISPETAAAWLQNLPADNVQRMPPGADRTRTRRYARLMLAGRWQVFPGSSFLLGKDGVLLDGRGRLSAVVASGQTIRSYVYQNPKRTSAHGLAVDQGIMRNTAYILQRPPALVRAAAYAFTMLHNRPGDHEELVCFCDEFFDIHQRLGIEGRKGFGTSAPVVLAAILAVASRKASVAYASDILDMFSRRDPRPLPPLPYSFYRQLMSEKLTTRMQLVRAFRALEQKNQNTGRLQIKEPMVALEEMRRLLRTAIEEWR